jgi:hypothetical protein
MGDPMTVLFQVEKIGYFIKNNSDLELLWEGVKCVLL